MPRGAAITFSATYDASYETAPTLSAFPGLYSGDFMFAMGRQAATVSIAESGAVSVKVGTGGCSATGTATSRTDANAYNLSLTFGPAPCKTANQSFNGIAYFNAATKRLYATAQNAARTDGVLFVGTKP
jgi:hypothetical protein